MANRFLRIAVLYVLVGVTLGIVMAASKDHRMAAVHAHINLLGWVTMALFGLFYRAVPAAAGTKLASAHFWIHNVALPIQMGTLAMVVGGNESVEPVLAIASVAIAVGLVCFAINLWKFTGARSA